MKFANQKVSLIGLKKEMRNVLLIAEETYKKHNKTLVITSGTDGCHSAASFHPYGYALDFRTYYFNSKSEEYEVANEIRKRLKAIDIRYGVLLEKDHLYIQYKPEWAD